MFSVAFQKADMFRITFKMNQNINMNKLFGLKKICTSLPLSQCIFLPRPFFCYEIYCHISQCFSRLDQSSSPPQRLNIVLASFTHQFLLCLIIIALFNAALCSCQMCHMFMFLVDGVLCLGSRRTKRDTATEYEMSGNFHYQALTMV